MKQTVATRGLSAGSLFKIIAIGYLFSLGLLVLFFGILSLLGAETIKVGDEPVRGLAGLLLSLLFIPVFVLVSSVLTWLCLAPGNWLYARRRSITLSYTDVGTDGGESEQGRLGRALGGSPLTTNLARPRTETIPR